MFCLMRQVRTIIGSMRERHRRCVNGEGVGKWLWSQRKAGVGNVSVAEVHLWGAVDSTRSNRRARIVWAGNCSPSSSSSSFSSSSLPLLEGSAPAGGLGARVADGVAAQVQLPQGGHGGQRPRHGLVGRAPRGGGRGLRPRDPCGVPTGTGPTGAVVKYCGLCGGCHGLPRGPPSEARSLSFWRDAWGGCHFWTQATWWLAPSWLHSLV